MNSRQIKALLFGASGLTGTAVLRGCLADPQVIRGPAFMLCGSCEVTFNSFRCLEILALAAGQTA